jgi:hypothetical protein
MTQDQQRQQRMWIANSSLRVQKKNRLQKERMSVDPKPSFWRNGRTSHGGKVVGSGHLKRWWFSVIATSPGHVRRFSSDQPQANLSEKKSLSVGGSHMRFLLLWVVLSAGLGSFLYEWVGWGWRRGISGFSGVVWRECTLLQSCIALCPTCKWMVTTFFAQEICNSRDWLHPLRLRSSLAATDAAPATYTQTTAAGYNNNGYNLQSSTVLAIGFLSQAPGQWMVAAATRLNAAGYKPPLIFLYPMFW